MEGAGRFHGQGWHKGGGRCLRQGHRESRGMLRTEVSDGRSQRKRRTKARSLIQRSCWLYPQGHGAVTWSRDFFFSFLTVTPMAAWPEM